MSINKCRKDKYTQKAFLHSVYYYRHIVSRASRRRAVQLQRAHIVDFPHRRVTFHRTYNENCEKFFS